MFKITGETIEFKSGVRLGFIRQRKRDPDLLITFSRYVCDVVPWKNGTPLTLKMGKEIEAGKIRIFPAGDIATGKYEFYGTDAKINFGHVPTLCKEMRNAKTARASVVLDAIDVEYIEITLPIWEIELPSFSRAKEAVAHKKRPISAVPIVHLDPSYIEYKGKFMDLFDFQAILLNPLVKGFGGILPPDVIIEKGFAAVKQPPHPSINFLLPIEMQTLGDKLRSIGLSIKHVKGVGYTLYATEE